VLAPRSRRLVGDAGIICRVSELRPIYSANLRAERARAGLHQADLAQQIGLPRATLADVEAGRRKVTLGEAVEICEALGIELSLLLAGNDPEALRARRVLCAEKQPPRESTVSTPQLQTDSAPPPRPDQPTPRHGPGSGAERLLG
jgi:putative transcriptional regulator